MSAGVVRFKSHIPNSRFNSELPVPKASISLAILPDSDEFHEPISELYAGMATVTEWHIAGCTATAKRYSVTLLVEFAVMRFGL